MPGWSGSASARRSLVQRPCLAQRRNWRETVSGLPNPGGSAAQGGGARPGRVWAASQKMASGKRSRSRKGSLIAWSDPPGAGSTIYACCLFSAMHAVSLFAAFAQKAGFFTGIVQPHGDVTDAWPGPGWHALHCGEWCISTRIHFRLRANGAVETRRSGKPVGEIVPCFAEARRHEPSAVVATAPGRLPPRALAVRAAGDRMGGRSGGMIGTWL